MKIAVIGSGISGLTAAWRLHKNHDVTVFEKSNYFGGHTDTHRLTIENKRVNVDTGFIVFNEYNYPYFTKMLDDLSVKHQLSDMSFAVDNRLSGLSYNPSQGNKLLAKPSNFLRPRFLVMLKDIKRFYEQCSAIAIDDLPNDLLVETFLKKYNYSKAFAEEHLYPMAGALWSMSFQEVKTLPLKFILGFFAHHKMLQVKDRPLWRTVSGGSQSYVVALQQQMQSVQWVTADVVGVTRDASSASVTYHQDNAEKTDTFDLIVMAAHADDALAILKDASEDETTVLSGFEYSDNMMVLHCDEKIMPANKKLWASWNVTVANQKTKNVGQSAPQYCITYWMNLLQSLDCDTPLLASLNPVESIDPEKIYLTRDYRHPKYHVDSFNAQRYWKKINGVNRTYYCGAYWGWGFHEDGARSAVDACELIKKQWTA